MKWIKMPNGLVPESSIIVIITLDGTAELAYKDESQTHPRYIDSKGNDLSKRPLFFKYFLDLPELPKELK